ncbi:DegT/DnrJ/EryC1/StrS family aminotransferase [candidate division WOR-3 bacterium]|nr:DegT/DnrJ/EryC1/StrS family aminotransferase [candidate division WOR-3 bacterium]
MTYRVPFVEPGKHYLNLKDKIDTTITDVFAKGDLVMRKQLRDFEEHLATFVGTKYAIGLNSGYHALHLSLFAAGISSGDEVITVAHTFVATISAIVHCGAVPVLIDVDKDYNMAMDKIEPAITSKTKAIIPVHLNGRLCNMDKLMTIAEKYNLMVIEDAAQSLGGKYNGKSAGSFGLAGCFSHYPFKILGGFGDGGALTTNDPEIARKTTLLRYNGEDRETGEYHYHGYTCLLDNVQAAVLDVKLKHLPRWIERRREIAELYHQGLSDIMELSLPHFEGEKYFDVYQNYVIRTKKRDELFSYLKEHGIETLIHWKKPVWEHTRLELGQYHLPETESLCKEVLSLPVNTEITDNQVSYAIECIRNFYGYSL